MVYTQTTNSDSEITQKSELEKSKLVKVVDAQATQDISVNYKQLCGHANYGEAEDYNIIVGLQGPVLIGPDSAAGTFVPPNSAHIAWFYGGNGEWLQHCGYNEGGMGLEDGGTFYVSAFWDAAMLANYYGYYMTKASIFPTSTDNASYELMVWTDENGGTTLVSQPLTGLVMDEWNDIELTLPVEIIPENNLWVGYKVTHNEGDNPVGLDDGPAVAGYGDMVSLDGVTWESLMNSYGMDFNFTIKAMVTNDVDGRIAQPLPNHGFKNQTHQSNFVFEKRTENQTKDNPRVTFLGHNIYRDDVLVGFAPVTQETYMDSNLYPGIYSYTVRALYEEGLSEPAGPAIVVVPSSPPPYLLYEPFEDYTAGGYLAQQANAMGRTFWTTWSNAPGTAEDPFVSNEQASAGSNSMVIEGANDCVLLLGDKTEGNYDIDFDIFVASGYLGYFNLLHSFAGAGSEWGLQVYFDENGTGTVDAGGIGAASFSFDYDEWIPVKININLDDDSCKFYINNNLVVSYQWSLGTFGTPGLNQLAAANFYAWSDGATSKYFIDEVTFRVAETPPPTPIIQIEPMSLVAYHPNPPMITTQIVTVTNTGDTTLNWDLTVNIEPNSNQKSPPDSPEAIERLSQREAKDGIVKHSLGLDPNGSEIPANYSPEKLKDALRGEIAYGNNLENNNFYSIDVSNCYAPVIGPASYMAFGGDFSNIEVDKMYIIDYNDDWLKTVDIETGVATPVVHLPCPMAPDGIWTELAIDKTDGTFYMTASNMSVSNLYKIIPGTGEIILVGNTGIAALISCTIDLMGVMYALDLVTDNIYTIDLETGVGTVLGPAGFNANYAQGMGYEAANDIVYLASYSTFAELRTLDRNTGSTTSVCYLPGETGAFGFLCYIPYLFQNDLGVQSFINPVSGSGLGYETVTIRVKNYGMNTQSNIPVSYTLDGGTPVTGIVPGPIAAGETADFTFQGTVNLSNMGQTYVFQGCTFLDGDENPENDCKIHNVTNLIPTYCDASTQIEDEYIANVQCGDIDNSSGWQGGVADYTNISTMIDAGTAQEITVTNGNAWASDIVYCWVDWNKDFEFEAGDELYMLTNVGGTGQIFTGSIYVPSDTQLGEYRLRIRMTYSTAPQPCGEATYGEIEDYTITVEIVNPNPWLSADPVSGTLEPGQSSDITVTFNSINLPMGTYSGLLTFTSNDPVNPEVNVPATLIPSGTWAEIAVNPDCFFFELEPGFIQTQAMNISNPGNGTLFCEMSITYGDFKNEHSPIIKKFNVEEYRANHTFSHQNTEAAPEGIAPANVETTDAMWDLQFTAPCGDANGEAGIETDGNFIYTTKWNGTGFFKYEMDGTFIGPMMVGNVSGIRDLAFDGTYFYGGAAATTVYKMDFSTQTLVGQFTAPTAVRAIAYDYDEDGFYANNWSTPIVLFDASGATLNTLPTAGDESYYGFAYDNNDGDKFLYGFSQQTGLSGGVIVELALPGGTPTGVSHDVVTELAIPGTDLAGGLFICNNWFTSGTTSIGGLVQNVVMFAYELHETEGPYEWLSLSTYQATINDGGSANIDVICNFDPFCDDFEYFATIWIANNSINNQLVEIPVDLLLDVNETGGKSYILMYPNPTFDVVNIKTNSNISQVRIFNQSGQMVLFENVSGNDVKINTSGLPPGNYIVEITTGEGTSTQKLVLR